MDINASFKMNLSLASIEEYREFLIKYSKKLPKVAENIVTEVSKVGLEDNYKSTTMIPVKNNGAVVSGGIRTNDEGETYAEFGTGIIGANNPHVAEYLEKLGWKYDVNKHGEKGWIYIDKEGNKRWTKGIKAYKKFYNASKKMEDKFQEIAKAEFAKASKS